jgi:hypothetical protein
VFGVMLLVAGLTMMATDQHTNLLWSTFEILALLSGGILVNRAITNKPLFKQPFLTRLADASNTRMRWLGLLGLMCLLISAIIPLLGSDNYFGYNMTYTTLSMACNLAIGILGALFLLLFLRSLKKA